MVSSTLGSATKTGWKRRASAASFSTCLRYSSSVVAPTQCSSPRASAGFRRFDASIAPSALPAPTSVCISSMKRMIWPDAAVTSESTAFSRSSNSPRYFAPAIKRAHVERHQLLVLQALRHVAVDDAERQAFGDGGLADAGLADQHGIVLGAAGEHLDGAADLLVAADDRVELAVARRFGQVAGVFLQRVIAGFRRGGVGGAALADVVDRLVQRVRRDAGIGEDLRGRGVLLHGERQQQPLDRDEGIAGLLGDLLGGGEDFRQRLREVELAGAAGDFRQLRQRRVGGAERRARIAAGALDQPRRHALAVVEQHLQEMLGQELLMALGQRAGLRGLDEALHPLGVFFRIHASPHSRPARATRSIAARVQMIGLRPERRQPDFIWCDASATQPLSPQHCHRVEHGFGSPSLSFA